MLKWGNAMLERGNAMTKRGSATTKRVSAMLDRNAGAQERGGRAHGFIPCRGKEIGDGRGCCEKSGRSTIPGVAPEGLARAQRCDQLRLAC
jgi:hypothetical protein